MNINRRFSPVFIFAFVIYLLAGYRISAQNRSEVHLSGTIKNLNNKLEVQDMSAVGDLSATSSDRFFIPDSTGHFDVNFTLAKPNYFRIGRNILYLSPGDNLSLDIDYNKPEAGKFSGTHANENSYLTKTPFPKAGSFIEAGGNIKPSIKETIDYVISAASERERVLSSYHNLSPAFKTLELGRIKADVLQSFWLMPTYYGIKHKLKGDSLKAFYEKCNKETEPYSAKFAAGLTDPGLIDLVVYRDALDIVKKYNAEAAISNRVKDFEKAQTLFAQMKESGDKAAIIPVLKQFDAVGYPDYKNALIASYKYFTGFGNGDKAVDILAYDAAHKPVHLYDFKGKIIVIDFWATWCGPCLELMPAFDKLKESYKDNANVVFISLSIDNNVAAWKKDLMQKQMTGNQFNAVTENMPDYSIKAIPRVILIDKNFVIADMKAPLPSGTGLDKAIKALLK